jgi:TetR/AcrR family transcriptional repressor of nem operon
MDLPAEVSAEVKKFFKMCHDKLVEEGLSSDEASQLLATITGALVVMVHARALDAELGREIAKAKPGVPAIADMSFGEIHQTLGGSAHDTFLSIGR